MKLTKRLRGNSRPFLFKLGYLGFAWLHLSGWVSSLENQMTASQSPFAEKSDGSLIAKIRQGDEEAASTELFDCQSERPTANRKGNSAPNNNTVVQEITAMSLKKL